MLAIQTNHAATVFSNEGFSCITHCADHATPSLTGHVHGDGDGCGPVQAGVVGCAGELSEVPRAGNVFHHQIVLYLRLHHFPGTLEHRTVRPPSHAGPRHTCKMSPAAAAAAAAAATAEELSVSHQPFITNLGGISTKH